MNFTPAEAAACERLVHMALAEDLAGPGTQRDDVTSLAMIPASLSGHAAFVARGSGVVAGLPAARMVCTAIDAQLAFQKLVEDGSPVEPGLQIAVVSGPMRSLLAAERTALNFLQHLSGVATLTSQFVKAIDGLPARVLDTRKTLPGWRLLQKYAVRMGGGVNHRMGLYDAVLIKDNHLAAMGMQANVAAAVEHVRKRHAGQTQIEVEVDTIEQLRQALAARPDIVLLDNMDLENLRAAVQCRNQLAPHVKLEASGGVSLQTVRAIAETGVDRISVGALTHSAPALDIALDYLP
jgi:nicotinate-nucleotide pyrophosphorylase (carboxylating)